MDANFNEPRRNKCHLSLILAPGVLDYVRVAPRVQPASKQEIANLSVITITEEALKKLGEDADCYICKEDLEEHNSIPICRHELQTDDHAYESWKEREKEAEEDRKGAANAYLRW
ncbi:E3 ubiquitin-protein ligase AIP2-like [Pyrus communis]|uniref:E3 ubiquitin-protein ligase AIP2-like n=1 Tax=Pyrus communis TaxID=23211 RepID=UPI0035C09DE8